RQIDADPAVERLLHAENLLEFVHDAGRCGACATLASPACGGTPTCPDVTIYPIDHVQIGNKSCPRPPGRRQWDLHACVEPHPLRSACFHKPWPLPSSVSARQQQNKHMSDQASSGEPTAAPTETSGAAPSAAPSASTSGFGSFSGTRGSGLARGK